ncbi:MAG: lysylphosphatidylglycerol synthetase [Verrucomicrobia bacterium]|nr:MAG: lysylphosphatidylglycerol synthetase [Verrucomicrobiota bacterium]
MRKLITLAISLLILAAIYYKIDIVRLGAVLAHADPLFLFLSLGMVVPLTVFTAWRLQILAPARAQLGLAEATRLILVASVLNMVLPSKMGDLAKAWFMKSDDMRGGVAFSLVIFEKAADMLSLLFWCALGLVFYPRKDAIFWILTAIVIAGLIVGILLLGSRSLVNFVFACAARFAPAQLGTFEIGWREMQSLFWSDRPRMLGVFMLSIFIWLLHVPFLANLGLAPLAISTGLLPFSFAGIGTRDAALIVLYRPYFAAPVAAALGLLCTARYVLPALAGLPFLHRYVTRSPHDE